MRVLMLLAAVPALAQLPTCSSRMWSPCELIFEMEAGEDPERVQLRGDFRSPHRDTKNLRAFRDGNRFVIRFTPDEIGEWDYRLTSSLKRLDGQIGKVGGVPSEAPGFVRSANVHHFQTADLQPHLWMATPVEGFLGMARTEFETAVVARAQEKFTHLRVTLEPGADLVEAASRVAFIHKQGLVTDIVLGAIPEGRMERERYLTDIIARFAAYNVTWAGVPAFEKLRNARNLMRETGEFLAQNDPYKHPRTTMAEVTSSPLAGDRWMSLLSYGTPDPNVGAVERQFASMPSINAGIRTRSELWNATMNGHYPASGAGKEFAIWFDFMAKTRYWELEPYFDVSGGRAVAVRDAELRAGDHIDAVEYIVYVEKPGVVELTVDDKGYDVAWMDPATGERVPAKGYKGKNFTGEPPNNEHDWVLHVSREGAKEGMLKRYKFESRPVLRQSAETNPASIPFELESPTGDISAKTPPFFSLKITKPSRATRDLLILWTAEMATGGDGARVVGVGREGTMQLPASFTERLPGVMALRVAVVNANGKAYVIDRALRLVP